MSSSKREALRRVKKPRRPEKVPKSAGFISMSNMNRSTQPVPGFLMGAALIPQVPEHVCTFNPPQSFHEKDIEMNHFEPLKGPVFQMS